MVRYMCYKSPFPVFVKDLYECFNHSLEQRSLENSGIEIPCSKILTSIVLVL